MPINKKQITRLIKFVAELRRNSYPNAATFAKKLRELDINENLNISCSERTIMRDLDTLRREFKAPIQFSAADNGYYLDNPYWEFVVPMLAEEVLVGSMLGMRLAEDIMPSPVKEQIRDAVDGGLANNNTELFDRTFLESLLIAAGTKTAVPPEIFETVFRAWRERRVLHFVYQKGTDGDVTERDFEPHIIACNKGNWYLKGIDRGTGNTAVFAIFRIRSAELGKGTFAIRKDILKETRQNGLFDYPKIEGITVKCAPAIAYYLYEQKRAKQLAVTPQPDGSLIVVLPPSPEHEAIRWILGEGGNVEVISPQSLREKVHLTAQKTAKINAGVFD